MYVTSYLISYVQISAANLSLLFVQMVKMGCLKELRALFYRLSKRYKDRTFLHAALYVQVRSMSSGMLILILMSMCGWIDRALYTMLLAYLFVLSIINIGC